MIELGVGRDQLLDAFDDIRLSGNLTEGKYTRKFEEAVEDWSGMHAIAVNSAGSGLLALYSMFQNTSVICPTNTFYATGGMAMEAGHKVELYDCCPATMSGNWHKIETVLNRPGRPKDENLAVVWVPVGGIVPEDYLQIAQNCRTRSIPLIVDAAHALGVKVAGMVPGQGAVGAVYSLYPTKAVPVGEGGVVVTSNNNVADFVRRFRNYGKYKVGEKIMYSRGFNLRMDEWTAAVAWLQMKRLPKILEARAEDACRLAEVIPAIPSFAHASQNNWYKYPVKREDAYDLGIKKFTGHVYAVSDQLTTALYPGENRSPLPTAEWVANTYRCLPVGEGLYAGMSKDEILNYLRS
jgi:perosamine synthetase